MLDHAVAIRVIGAGTRIRAALASDGLPEPLASVVDYLSDELDSDEGRDFVPSAELTEALDLEPTAFGRQMAEGVAVRHATESPRRMERPPGRYVDTSQPTSTLERSGTARIPQPRGGETTRQHVINRHQIATVQRKVIMPSVPTESTRIHGEDGQERAPSWNQ